MRLANLIPFLLSGGAAGYLMDWMFTHGWKGFWFIPLAPGLLFGFAVVRLMYTNDVIDFGKAIGWLVFAMALHWVLFMLTVLSGGLLILVGISLTLLAAISIGEFLKRVFREQFILARAPLTGIGLLAGILGFGLTLLPMDSVQQAGIFALYGSWQIGVGMVVAHGFTPQR